jgi:replicative DNA helicase
MQAMVRQDREETKNMLLDILKNQMGEVKQMAFSGDVRGVETIISGLQKVTHLYYSPMMILTMSRPGKTKVYISQVRRLRR